MKMHRFLKVLVLAFFVMSLAACAAQPTSSAVQVSDALKLAINGLVLFLVTLGLQWVFDNVGLDLRGIGAALAAAVAGFFLLQLQGVIDVIPAAYDMAVTIGLNILLAILSGAGFFRAFLQRERAAQLFSGRGH